MKKLAFFDVDNVFVNGQTQKLLLKYLFSRHKISWSVFVKIYFWFVLYKLGMIKDTMKIRACAFKLMKGWDEMDTKKLFKDFFHIEIKPRIFKKCVNFIDKHIKQNYEIILVSASIYEIVNELKEFLSLKEAIATQLEIKNNKYTGNIVGMVPYGKNKADAIKEMVKNRGFSLDGSYAYADHISDLPLLEIVSNPIVVNPDKELLKTARDRGWNVYQL